MTPYFRISSQTIVSILSLILVSPAYSGGGSFRARVVNRGIGFSGVPAGPVVSARPFLASSVPLKAPPLSGFLNEVRARDGMTVLRELPSSLEASVAMYYHEPPESVRKSGHYYMTPTKFEFRPGHDISRDVFLIKKALSSLPRQIENVWPAWRESVVEKIGITSRPNDYEKWEGPRVYVDLISREPVSKNYYQIVRLEKHGRRWVRAEVPKEHSAIALYTKPVPAPTSGSYSMALAEHSLRDSDVVKDVQWLSRSLRRLLKVPQRYANYIIETLSLGFRTNDQIENGRPALNAMLVSNNPLSKDDGRSNRYERVTLVTR